MKLQKYKITTTIALISILIVIALMTPTLPPNTVEAADADLLQYEWPTPDGDKEQGFLTAGGPAPSTQDILWTSDLGEPISAFNGMVFLSGGWAVDAFTGNPIYEYLGAGATKISETQFISQQRPSMFAPSPKYGTLYVYETNTGQLLYQYSIPEGIPTARSGALAYNQDLGIFWTMQGVPFFGTDHIMYAWDWPNVSQEPTLKWEKNYPKRNRDKRVL
jgi:outer membrane protein assembly factor BamB